MLESKRIPQRTVQWEILAIFGSLQNPDFILWGQKGFRYFGAIFGHFFFGFCMRQKGAVLPTALCNDLTILKTDYGQSKAKILLS